MQSNSEGMPGGRMVRAGEGAEDGEVHIFQELRVF